jgi:hypothetical protein
MNLSSLAGLLSLHLCTAAAIAQIITANTSPLDVPTDPRSVAMGESFVALPGNPTALMSNPAGLAGLTGLGVSYAQRSLNWMKFLEDYKYHGANGYIAVPFGVFGIQYNRFSMGEATISTSTSPDGIGKMRLYEHAFVLGFGRTFGENFSAGIAAKYFNIVNTVISITTPNAIDFTTTPAYLFDAGAQYSTPVFPGDSLLQNAVTAGISVQNIGTEVKSASSLIESEANAELPRYLRVGFSYQLKILSRQTDGLQPASMILTAEYRRLINSSIYADSQRDYWVFGVEFGLFEIIAFRLGGVINPYTSIYGKTAEFAARGGIGLNLPFAKLGVPVPFSVSGSYSFIPINRYPNQFMTGTTDNLEVFSIGLEYALGF